MKSFIISLFILTLIKNINTSESFLFTKKNEICSKTSEYVDSFFSTPPSSSPIYSLPNINYKNIDSNIFQIIFLNKNSETNKFIKNKFAWYIFAKYIIIFFIVISFIIIGHFELHFLFMMNKNDESEITENDGGKFVNLIKITPFGYYKTFYNNKSDLNIFLENYKEKRFQRIKKINKIIFLLVILISLIVTLYNSTFNYVYHLKNLKKIYNSSCSIMKLFDELKYGNRISSEYIGVEQSLLYFRELKIKIKELQNNFNEINNSLNSKTKSKIEKWNNLLLNISNQLSDKDTKEYFFENYPSDPKNIKNNLKDSQKNLFQAEIIYNFYPFDDSKKISYLIKKNFDNLINNINQRMDYFENTLSTVKKTTDSVLNNNYMDFYQKFIEKLNKILYSYLNEIEETYIPKIHKTFVSRSINLFFSLDYLVIFALIIGIIICIIFIENKIFNRCLIMKKMSMCFLFNIIFLLLFLSLFEIYLFLSIKQKLVLFKEIYKGVIFLLDKTNNNYLNNMDDLYIKDTDLKIELNNNYHQNIFYFINTIIEDNGKINTILKIPELNYNNLNDISSEIKNINKIKNQNEDLSNYIEKLEKILKSGLTYDMTFKDINGKGYLNGYESPLSYLSYVNCMTRSYVRTDMYKNKYPDFECDETWNISTTNYNKYVYMKRDYVIDCKNCKNHFSKKNPPLLLNFMEYSLDEIKQRYGELEKNASDVYYYLVYYFTACDNLRNDKIFEPFKKLYNLNLELETMHNEIILEINNNLDLLKKIISLYEIIYKEGFNIYLNCDFLRNDLFFTLNEIKTTFNNNLYEQYNKQLIINIINIFICSLLIITYCIVSYKIPYYDTRRKHEESSIRKILNMDRSGFLMRTSNLPRPRKMDNEFFQKINNDICVVIANDEKKTNNEEKLDGKDMISNISDFTDNDRKKNDFSKVFEEKEEGTMSEYQSRTNILEEFRKKEQ